MDYRKYKRYEKIRSGFLIRIILGLCALFSLIYVIYEMIKMQPSN